MRYLEKAEKGTKKKMQDVKVSIIVPIYNVEKYIDRCVNSLVCQTYRNIEIILVDDGSKDLSGKKADEWRNKDERIIVIHKKNGGLSAARNMGIEKSTGSHLVFVDSDDWIHGEMIERLVEELTQADIVCCGMIRANETEQTEIEWFPKKLVVSGTMATKLLVENSLFTSHIQKNIFPKSLFDSVKFPEGKVYEDIRTAHKLFLQVDKVCILPEHYYYYFERSNSITNIVKLGNQLEWFDALDERAEELAEMLTLEEKERVRSQKAVVMSLAIAQNHFSSVEKKKYKIKMQLVKEFLRQKETKKVVRQYATNSQYVYFCIARVFFYHANTIYRCMRKRK